MAIRLVNHVHAGIAQGGGTTGAIDTTGANLLVLFAGSFQVNGPSFTVSDSKNNVWTLLSGNNNGGVWYSINATSGPGHTFTVGSSGYPPIIAQAFSGVQGLDTGVFSTAGSAQPGPVTPSAPGSLLVTFNENDDPNAPTPSIDTGFTVTDSVPYNAGVNYGGAGGYLIQSVPAAVNPTWTLTPSGGTNVRTFIQGFKPINAPLGTLAVSAGLTLQQNDLSQDFLHLTDSLGNVIGWIDSSGVFGGTLASASTIGRSSSSFNARAVLSITGNGNDDYMQFLSNTSNQLVVARITAAGVYTPTGNPTNRALKKVFIDNGSAAFGTTNFLVLRTNLYDTLNSIIGWIDQFGNLGGTL